MPSRKLRHDVGIVIPARLQSQRLPRKILRNIAGRPLIEHVWRRVRRCRSVCGVWVATDSEEVADRVRDFGGEAVMTSSRCVSGTDRVFEAVKKLGLWGAVNVQGDEPFMSGAAVDRLAAALAQSDGRAVFTLVRAERDPKRFRSPHVVKAVVNDEDRAIYFSRVPVPFARPDRVTYYEHVGVYGYSRSLLKKFVGWGATALERRERLEQLRFLEHGVRIQVLHTRHKGFGIDTPADLRRAEKRIKQGTH